MDRAIVDAGPLIAFFDRKERYHDWVGAQVTRLESPLLVCEPVIAEAMYRLRHLPAAQEGIFAGLERGAFRIALHLEDQIPALRYLHKKYRDQPMSLADACVVRMAELHDRYAVLTLDSDFSVYRKHGRAPLTLIYPAQQ